MSRNPTGYRCGGIGDYTGGRRSEARIAWRALDYEYRELGNEYIHADVSRFLGLYPVKFAWSQVIAEFRRRYGDVPGIWLSTSRSHALYYYGEYGRTEYIKYNQRDIVINAGDEVYVIDRSGDLRNPVLEWSPRTEESYLYNRPGETPRIRMGLADAETKAFPAETLGHEIAHYRLGHPVAGTRFGGKRTPMAKFLDELAAWELALNRPGAREIYNEGYIARCLWSYTRFGYPKQKDMAEKTVLQFMERHFPGYGERQKERLMRLGLLKR